MSTHVPDHAEPVRSPVKPLLDAEAIAKALSRIAHELIERNGELDRVASEVDRPEGTEKGRPPLGLIGGTGAGDADGGVGRHRATDEHDPGVRRQPVPIRQRLADSGLARPVEDHTQGAVLAVLEDEHDRAEEVRVVQRGRGDEQTSAGRIAHPPMMARPRTSG